MVSLYIYNDDIRPGYIYIYDDDDDDDDGIYNWLVGGIKWWLDDISNNIDGYITSWYLYIYIMMI